MRSRSQLSKSKVSIQSARVPTPSLEVEAESGVGDALGRVDVERRQASLLLDKPRRRLVGRTSVDNTTSLGEDAEVVEILEDLRPWLMDRGCQGKRQDLVSETTKGGGGSLNEPMTVLPDRAMSLRTSMTEVAVKESRPEVG